MASRRPHSCTSSMLERRLSAPFRWLSSLSSAACLRRKQWSTLSSSLGCFFLKEKSTSWTHGSIRSWRMTHKENHRLEKNKSSPHSLWLLVCTQKRTCVLTDTARALPLANLALASFIHVICLVLLSLWLWNPHLPCNKTLLFFISKDDRTDPPTHRFSVWRLLSGKRNHPI